MREVQNQQLETFAKKIKDDQNRHLEAVRQMIATNLEQMRTQQVVTWSDLQSATSQLQSGIQAVLTGLHQ